MFETDLSIANAYINSNEPFFGTMGIAHLQGVQTIFLEESNPNLCFFHLYSTDETLMEKIRCNLDLIFLTLKESCE